MNATRASSRAHGLVAAVLALVPAALPAQGEGHPASKTLKITDPDSAMEDKIGTRIDNTLQFQDERGYPLQLRQFFPGARPVILDLGYFGCPGLCGEVMNGMVDALNQIELEPSRDYEILSISIDPREGAPESTLAKDKKNAFLVKLTKLGGQAGWHFATGQQDAIKAITDQVGFRYYWAEHENRFDHPPALIFLSPEGKVTRVLQGTTYQPRDVELALKEAAQGKLSTLWDSIVLSCLTFDSTRRSYSLTAMTVMKLGGVVTLIALCSIIIVMLRREKKRHAAAASA
jgi:protein SCO1/2